MLDTYLAAGIPAVRAEGGDVDKLIGDAVMAVFNLRGDQPDHALRAVRAGLGLQAAVAPIARAHPDWPRFRVGVNTGPVVIGNVGADVHRSFSAIGDTTNVAARLQAMSTPGHITIAERTLREARSTGIGDIEAVSIGAVDLKGKAEPTEAYELVSVGEESGGDR